MAQTEHPKLGSYLQSKLDERKMSANALSFAAGVAQSTISLLLRQGEDLDLPGTHPQVLSSVCNVLDLDYLYVFQLAEYIPFDYEPPVTANAGNFIQREFGNLTRGRQKSCWRSFSLSNKRETST